MYNFIFSFFNRRRGRGVHRKNMATVLLSPQEFLDPPPNTKPPQTTGGRPSVVPDATKLDLIDLWHNDERIGEVARAYRADSTSAHSTTYATDEIEFCGEEWYQGRVVPSSRYRELFNRRMIVLSEAHRADAARFLATQGTDLERHFDPNSNEAEDEESDESSQMDDEGFADFSPDSGSGNMLGIPLERPPSLTQRTLDCGASVSLVLLSSVGLERPEVLKVMLKNIEKWLAHCVPCSLSPHTEYNTVLSAGTVRKLLEFLLEAWKNGNSAAVKLAIQLAISRGELPLLVEVAWGLVATDPSNKISEPEVKHRKSSRRQPPGVQVMNELMKARDFLFSTYCPSRRLALPTCLRAERRVAVGPGSVQGLTVATGKASVLVATSGVGASAILLQMESGGGVDKRTTPPFVIDADSIPSIAAISDDGGLAIAPASHAEVESMSSAPPSLGSPPKHSSNVALQVATCETVGGPWRQLKIRLKHNRKPGERVLCKVVSCASVAGQKRIAVVSVSGVPVDEKSTTGTTSPFTAMQRRLLGELQPHPEWEAALAHVRAGTLPVEAAADSLAESLSRGGSGEVDTDDISPLLQEMARHSDRNDDDPTSIPLRAYLHWVDIPPVDEVPFSPKTPQTPTPETPTPTTSPSPGTGTPDGSPSSPVPVMEEPQGPPPIIEPLRSVMLRIPHTSRKNRHHQSALSLTRNSLPEFAHPLPKLGRTQPCTLEAWVRGAVDSPATILCWGMPEYRVHLSIDRQKRHTLYFVGSTTKHQHRGVSASVPGPDSHHWVHLCVTHDGNQGWSLYRNGNLIGEPHQKDAHDKPTEPEDSTHATPGMRGVRVPRTSSIPDMRQSDRTLRGSVGNAFVGCVAEARVWSVCRTAEQVRTYLHTSLSRRECSPQSGLLAYWPMDQSVGIQSFDHSSHRRHLLLQDGATWEHVPDMPVFRRAEANPEGWPVYVPSLRGLSVFATEKEVMLSVPKLSGGSASSRVISTYDATSGNLLRERLVPIGVPVVCQGVTEGSEGGTTLPLDGPLALDTTSNDIWALSQPTGLLVAGFGGSETAQDDDMPSVESSSDNWAKVAGKGLLNVLASLAQRHTPSAPAVLSSLYLSPVVSCLKRLCRLLALGKGTEDVDLCKGAAGLLNACFSQNGWSPLAINRNQDMLEELYRHACAVADNSDWATPSLTKAVEDLLRSGVSAGVFFPSTILKVDEFHKLLQQGWGPDPRPLSRSEGTVLNVLVGALAGASAHYLLRGAPVAVTLKQLLAAVAQPNAPPLLPLAFALQRCVVGLATTGEELHVSRLIEYISELFRIAKEETPEAPTATSTLVPLLLGALPLLYTKISQHCDLEKLLRELKLSLIQLATSPVLSSVVCSSEAASTFWHEVRLMGSSTAGSCAAYEFGAATSVALTVDTLGDYTLVYWDPNKPGSLLNTTEMSEMRLSRVTLETSRIVVAEVQKENRRRRRGGSDRDLTRPVSGVIRAFGTEMAPRIGWLLDLLSSVFNVSAHIAAYKGPHVPPSPNGNEWVTSSPIFQGGIVSEPQQDICCDVLRGTEEGIHLWKEVQRNLELDTRPLPGGQGTSIMIRAMFAALMRLSLPYPVASSDVQVLAPLLSVVEIHRDAICARLRIADDGDDLVVDTFVHRCEFIVKWVRGMGCGKSLKKTLTRKASSAELTEVQRRLHTITGEHDDVAVAASKELFLLATAPNVELDEIEIALKAQRDLALQRASGFKMCAELVEEAGRLPLGESPRGFILLEVLRVAVACVAACGPHPLSSCKGCGPKPANAVRTAFFDLLKQALEADQIFEDNQRPQLQSLQVALMNLDWEESDLPLLVQVGALKKLRENCSMPAEAESAVVSSGRVLHLAPDLWRGRSTVGRGLLSLKLSADALGAAVYCPPGEPGSSGWVWDTADSNASTHAAETEALHTTTPWTLDPPVSDSPRDVTCGCEYFEVRLTSVPTHINHLPGLERHPRNTIAIGIAKAPPPEGGAPKQFVWWKLDGSFAAELGSDAPRIPESNTQPGGRGGPVPVGYVAGHTIGCGVLKGTNEVFYTRNGNLIGFHAAVPGGEWYPTIWLGSKACLQCKFSPPFKFAARHPFVRPLSENEVLERRVRSSAWRAMTSVALKAARFNYTDPKVINPITELISSGIGVVLKSPSVKWGRARAALSVLVRVAAGKGVALKPLVPADTTNALFRLACDPDAPLVLRVQSLGVLCPVVSQSSPGEWNAIIESATSFSKTKITWQTGLRKAFSQLGIPTQFPNEEIPSQVTCNMPGDGMVRLLEELMLPSLPFVSTGHTALAVASTCLLRALLGSPSWQNTVATAIGNRLSAFANFVKKGGKSKDDKHPPDVATILDTSIGSGFLAAFRILGALPSVTECGMRVLVHSPGAASTLATVTEWHSNLQSARVLSEGVAREVAVSRLEPADGPVACSSPLPQPQVGNLLHATLEAAEAAFELVESNQCDVQETYNEIANPLPYLRWLAEVSCESVSDSKDQNVLGLLITIPQPSGGVTSLKSGVAKLLPSSIARWCLASCLRLLEAYAEQHSVATRIALVERKSLLRKLAQFVTPPADGWTSEVVSSPSRAHLEALSVHQLSQLNSVGWGTLDSSRAKHCKLPRQQPRRTLKVEPRTDFNHFADKTTHSCDGCGHQPLQIDTGEWSVGWYRCNVCADFDLCGRCYRRGVIHSDLVGHSFTDISQLNSVDSHNRLQTSGATYSQNKQNNDQLPLTPTSLASPRFAGKRFVTALLASANGADMPWVEALVASSGMQSGGSDVAALFPSGADSASPQSAHPSSSNPHQGSMSEAVINTKGYPAVKGTDGLYRCGVIVDGESLCRCGYCQMYATSRCGPLKGCSCTACQALDRRTPDCVIDMQGIREQVQSSSMLETWTSLHDVSHALCSISSRAIISVLAPEAEVPSSPVTQARQGIVFSSFAELIPTLLDWSDRWELAGDFAASLLDHHSQYSNRGITAALSIVECVVKLGGTHALHTLMGRLLALCCQHPNSAQYPMRFWKATGIVRVSSAPTHLSVAYSALLPGQLAGEVSQCGKWLHHQYGWSLTEGPGGQELLIPNSPPVPKLNTRRKMMFQSSFDSALSVLRPLLLGTHGFSARAGRWPLATLLENTDSSNNQKGVSILAALVASAHMHSRRRRRDALALVADLVPIFLKQYEGTMPLAVSEGVEALAPLLRHVLAANRVAPLSVGASVWHAALELLVRLRRGLASAGASDLLDDLVQSTSARLAKVTIFALVEAFEDCVERIGAPEAVPLPKVLTEPKKPDLHRMWTDGNQNTKHHNDSRRRTRRVVHDDRSEHYQNPNPASFLPAPVPDVDQALITAYRWGRPGGIKEASHPVLGVKQWSALAQLVSSITKSQSNVFKQTPEVVYRALQHHVRPTDQLTGLGWNADLADGISVPLPDLSKSEVASCLTTLLNINSILLIPIIYYLDLSPHGIQHSSLSTKFMSMKGLMLTQCKEGVVAGALRQTEVCLVIIIIKYFD